MNSGSPLLFSKRYSKDSLHTFKQGEKILKTSHIKEDLKEIFSNILYYLEDKMEYVNYLDNSLIFQSKIDPSLILYYNVKKKNELDNKGLIKKGKSTENRPKYISIKYDNKDLFEKEKDLSFKHTTVLTKIINSSSKLLDDYYISQHAGCYDNKSFSNIESLLNYIKNHANILDEDVKVLQRKISHEYPKTQSDSWYVLSFVMKLEINKFRFSIIENRTSSPDSKHHISINTERLNSELLFFDSINKEYKAFNDQSKYNVPLDYIINLIHKKTLEFKLKDFKNDNLLEFKEEVNIEDSLNNLALSFCKEYDFSHVEVHSSLKLVNTIHEHLSSYIFNLKINLEKMNELVESLDYCTPIKEIHSSNYKKCEEILKKHQKELLRIGSILREKKKFYISDKLDKVLKG